MPTPAPVIGATLAMIRSTSAKASVTSAKYEPFNPDRKLSAPITAPTSAPAAMPINRPSHALMP